MESKVIHESEEKTVLKVTNGNLVIVIIHYNDPEENDILSVWDNKNNESVVELTIPK